MRVMKWVGIGVGAILGLAVLAALVLPSLVNLERYRAALAGRAGRTLGREVTLGALRIHLWGGIGAEARGIQIAQAPGFGAEPFLAADALRVRVELLPLLRGEMKLRSAVLDRPRIHLMHTRDGRWSIEDLLKTSTPPSPSKPSGEPPRPGKTPVLGSLVLSEVAVRNGEVTLVDQAHSPGITLTLTDLDLSLRQAGVSDPLEIRSQAKIGGIGAGRIDSAVRIAAADSDAPVLDATVRLRDVEAGPWQALLLSGGRTKLSGPLSAEIRVTGPVTRAVFAGTLDLKPMAIHLGETFRKAAGEEARLRFEGQREDGGVDFRKLSLTLKGMTLEGTARVPDLAVPRMTFMASAEKLNLDRLLERPASKQTWLGPAVASAAVSPAELRPKTAGTSSAGAAFAAQGRISVGDLRYGGLALTAVQADVRYRDGLVQLPDLRADFMKGKLTAKGEVDLRPKVPRATLTSRLDNVATEPLIRALALGTWTLRSALNFDGDLTFVGFSSPEILGSAAGGGSLLMKDGRLDGYKPLDRLSEVILPILATQGVRVRLNEFDQVSGHYTLDKGVLRTKDLTLTKAEGTVTAVGSLGLLDSSLNFDVVAKLGRTTVEAKVTGTTSQPIVVPKLGRLQERFEIQLDKPRSDQQGKSLKEIFKGLFGK
ncbi:MAG TPA: AsmA-like C-terminal region-containing protein [Candidatus Methylomirabilis sp.]|nr:AsmA-like C-terminal region-containing protein [Candidatus Methylomirabilis sp.]